MRKSHHHHQTEVHLHRCYVGSDLSDSVEYSVLYTQPPFTIILYSLGWKYRHGVLTPFTGLKRIASLLKRENTQKPSELNNLRLNAKFGCLWQQEAAGGVFGICSR
ncbi:hypothetical protein PoB_007314000 [Plakobranchus ocellatus]|uniref:Uncharacterized protein n=1 Tax=Plakobranchus ocellatus TaxID=259542 RepID=A0AAV4DRE8_9GAST|nr:hypothetical protein PoB_007314000 [Plakobranchus ocellatus]